MENKRERERREKRVMGKLSHTALLVGLFDLYD